MPGRGDNSSRRRPVVYCLVPRDLAAKLHEPLRRHFRDDPSVEVIVERRARERRRTGERRAGEAEAPAADRRAIRGVAGRRVAERRASLVPAAPPPLPRRAQRHADRLVFVARLEPASEQAEDRDSARLVTRFQAGDAETFGVLYTRYFDRVYNYLRLVLNDPHEAEDATQQAFLQVLEALPRYERRRQPFRAWLFVVVRNYAVDYLRKRAGVEIEEAAEINRRREAAALAEPDLTSLGWITDRELLMFVERLPLPQRQVLLLRFMLDLRVNEIAQVLRRSPNEISALQHRALRFLRERLTAIGRDASGRSRDPMRRWVRPARVLRRRRFSLGP